MLCGIFEAGALITKLVSICFIIVFSLAIIIYYRFNLKIFFLNLLGLVCAFVSIDLIKLKAFSFNFSNYLKWWVEYYKYNKRLFDAGDTGFVERLRSFCSVFGLTPYISILLLLFVVFWLVWCSWRGVFRGKWILPIEIIMIGVSGLSYILLNLFWGNGAAINHRRLIIFYLPLLVSVIQSIVYGFLFIWRGKEKITTELICGIVLLCCLASLLPSDCSVKALQNSFCYSKDRREAQIEMVNIISGFPENSEFITYDWQTGLEIINLSSFNLKLLNNTILFPMKHYYYVSYGNGLDLFSQQFECKTIYEDQIHGTNKTIIEVLGTKDS